MCIHLRNTLLSSFILTISAKPLLAKRELEARGSAANRTEVIPSPLVVPPSQYWDGDDGLWSSFALRVGTPAQDVRVLVSTNSPKTLVVLPSGCTTTAINPVPNDCANSRGGLFNPNTSSTWQNQGLFGINQDGVGFEANLGYTQNADYGFETLGLGFVAGGASGPTLEKQPVAGIATVSPFYLGILGLKNQPVNYSTIGNSSAPSYFSSLRSQQIIPSLSWSFTAGAKYRLKAGQYAQLIFGGYDSSRFAPNSASFTLNEDINRDVVVAIQSITYSGTAQSTLLSTPIFAFVESTDPNIWLPESACNAFERAFGISIDASTGLYLINATQYIQLQTLNPEVTFTLSNSLLGGETVSIVLPFNALGLPATSPFTPNDTYYFPLRKAANDSQNTLGRAFLQEAYLTVDYERGNFSVSQCVWQDGAAEQISAILSPTYANIRSDSNSSASTSKPISPGVIAGAVIAGIAVLIVAAGLGYLIARRRRRPSSSTLPMVTEGTGTILTNLDNKDQSLYPDYHSFYSPPYKKLDSTGSVHRGGHGGPGPGPDGELDTQGEIFQLPTVYNSRLPFPFERSIAHTPTHTTQIDGGGGGDGDGANEACELYGSEPVIVEMDDEKSRLGLGLASDSVPLSPTLDLESSTTGPCSSVTSTAHSSSLG